MSASPSFHLVERESKEVNKQAIDQVIQEAFLETLERASAIDEKKPFFTEADKEFWLKVYDVILFPVSIIAWLLAKPVQAFTWAVVKIKTHRYDPEKRVCPGCGFKGDSGTNGKTCRVEFTRTAGPERAGIRHTCFRCGCDKHISPLFRKAAEWLPQEEVIITEIHKKKV